MKDEMYLLRILFFGWSPVLKHDEAGGDGKNHDLGEKLSAFLDGLVLVQLGNFGYFAQV